MPRRKSLPLDEMKTLQHQPRSRHPHSSMIGGAGLYAGSGLYLGSGLEKHHHKSLTGHSLIGYGLPPALQSQPYSSHYQWSVTLPPAYQRIVKGNGLY